MNQSITMPTLSDTMTTGRLVRWLKAVGDAVKSGDAVAEVETDKAVMEVEAFHDGFLAGPLAATDKDLPVGQIIGYIADKPGEAVAEAKADKPAVEATKPEVVPPKVPDPVIAKAPLVPADPAPPAHEHDPDSSPLARREAEQAGVDLSDVKGTGPHGRIISADVAAAKAATDAEPAQGGKGMSEQQIRALYPVGSYDFVPHSGMRRMIAQRLVQSSIGVPHFDLTIACDIGKLLEARHEMNSAAPKGKDGKPQWKLSVTDFIIKALALALQRVPDANATWTDSGMLMHAASDIGVAVAIKGGLIAPLIRSADSKSLSAIATELQDLAARAIARKLTAADYEGGASTVSNLGMDGILNFNAVLNPPQATILAVGAGEERAVIRAGKVEAAMMMTVTLTCDHRVVDGALGAALLAAFKAVIEHPETMAA
jgi:pyruvate dehydrogenase E2 component (dihydrolipoamide acetyltransferase)